MMAYQGMAAMGRKMLPRSEAQCNRLIAKHDGSYLSQGRKLAEQCHAVVALKSVIQTDAVTAVPMELRDGYGRILKNGLEIETTDGESKGSRRELCTDKDWIRQGLLMPNATLRKGT